MTQTVSNIVKEQKADGSWSNPNLLDGLFSGKEDYLETLKKKYDPRIVITWLLMTWIERNHSGKEYILILRKAKAFVNQELSKSNTDKAKFEEELEKAF
mgnify:CR=1 FL=1